jgi:hypothetical protein
MHQARMLIERWERQDELGQRYIHGLNIHNQVAADLDYAPICLHTVRTTTHGGRENEGSCVFCGFCYHPTISVSWESGRREEFCLDCGEDDPRGLCR